MRYTTKIMSMALLVLLFAGNIDGKVWRRNDCRQRTACVSQPDPFHVKTCSRCCKPGCFSGRWRTRYLGYPYYQKGNYYAEYPDYPYGINSEGGYARRWW